MGPMEANWKMSTLIDSSIRQSGSCHAHQTSCLHWGMTSLPLWDQHSNPQGAELEVVWGHNLPTGTLGFPEFLRLGLGTGQQPDVQHDEDSARRKANPVRLPHMENHQLSCTPGKAGWSYSAVLCVSVSGVHRGRQWEPVTKRVTFGSQGGGLGDYASTHKKHTILKRGPPQIYLPLLQKTVSIIRLPVSPLDKALWLLDHQFSILAHVNESQVAHFFIFVYNTPKEPSQRSHSIHILLFIHKSGLFEYVCRHSGTELSILTHSACSPLRLLTMHSSGDAIWSLPCIVPRRDCEAAAASYKKGLQSITSSS